MGDVGLTPRIGWYGLIKVGVKHLVQMDIRMVIQIWFRGDPIDGPSSRVHYVHCCDGLAAMRQWKVTAQRLWQSNAKN